MTTNFMVRSTQQKLTGLVGSSSRCSSRRVLLLSLWWCILLFALVHDNLFWINVLDQSKKKNNNIFHTCHCQAFVPTRTRMWARTATITATTTRSQQQQQRRHPTTNVELKMDRQSDNNNLYQNHNKATTDDDSDDGGHTDYIQQEQDIRREAEQQHRTTTFGIVKKQSSRRNFVLLSAMPMVLTASQQVLLLPTLPSNAIGLEQFPQTSPFANCYHLLRAGTSLLEEDDIWSTNPLFLTNREDALSPQGEEQVVASCQILKQPTLTPTVVRHSLAAATVDTANVIGRELVLGRDRVGAEYTFLDPRAIGQWDMLQKSKTIPAIWAMDDMEAGIDGTGARPPPNDDGTPNETLADQMIRLRQLFSLLETQYSGDTILLIFPDGTGPAVLSAMIAGIPLNRVHELELEPGELRLNVTRNSIQELWQSKNNNNNKNNNGAATSSSYQQILKDGRIQLIKLRSTKTFVNRKDERIEAERIAIEKQYNIEQEQKQQQQIQAKLEQERQEQKEAVSFIKNNKKKKRQEEEEQKDDDDTIICTTTDQNEMFKTGLLACASFLSVLGGVTQFGNNNNNNNNDDRVKRMTNTTNAMTKTAMNTTMPTTTTTTASMTTTNATTAATSSSSSSVLSSYFDKSSSSDPMLPSSSTTTNNNNTKTIVVTQQVNGDPQSTLVQEMILPSSSSTKTTKSIDPYTAAKQAMENYMNEDDGGDACKCFICCLVYET